MKIKDEKLKIKKFIFKLYMQALGSLLYLVMGTRLDIILATNKVSKRNQNPTYDDWINALKIFKYLNYTKYCGLKITNNKNVTTYVDTDFRNDEETKKKILLQSS